MPLVIDVSSGPDGIWTIEDDGTPGNGTSVVRQPGGVIFTTFAHPADSLTILGRAGQDLNINITDSLTTADFTVGSLTSPTVKFDNVGIAGVLTAGTVTLTANNAVSELGSDAATDIVAGTLFLDAGTGVGVGNAIETQVSTLEAESVTGGINLSTINNVTIGGAGGTSDLRGLFTGTSGNITLANQGSITLADDDGVESVHSARNLTMSAIGATADISSTVDQDSLFAVGDISLSAGHDVLFGTVGTDHDNDVRAGGSINVTAGRDFHIDGFSDMASDDQGLGTNGGITITVGRDILIEDDTGADASVGVSASASTGSVVLTTGVGGTLSLAADSSAAIQGRLGGVQINADRILIENDSGASITGPGSIRLNGASAGRPIILGSALDGVTAVELADAEIDRLFASLVRIGSPASSGDITILGPITPADETLSLESVGAIIDGNALGQDVTGDGLALRASGGIGSADPLDLQVAGLAFQNTGGGNVKILNTGGLTITGLAGLATSSNTGGGTTTISAASPLTFAVNTASVGTATYTAGETSDAPIAADDLTINGGVIVSVTGGDLVLQGGDEVVLGSGAQATASGSITVTAGFADLDGLGAIISHGLIQATAGVTMTAINDISPGRVVGGALTSLATTTGAIIDSNATGADIDAPSLTLAAFTGIGTPADRLETDVGTLEAETGSGDIAIENTGDLIIGGLSATIAGLQVATAGSIDLLNAGSITLADTSGSASRSRAVQPRAALR